MSTVDLSTSFDAIAAAYDRARPEYPEEVFDRILSYARIQQVPADILEVGSGTGKATEPLARLGHRLVCLEPGPNLVQFARHRFASLPNVVIQETSFEQWDPGVGKFDIAFAAQAFHWLDRSSRLPKLASVLRPNGVLAVFGHSSDLAPPDLGAAIRSAYRVHAPELSERDNARSWYASLNSPLTEEVRASGLFRDLEFHATEWSRDMTPEEYIDLIGTYSDHSTLQKSRQAPLLHAIREAIRKNGNTVRLDYRTALFLARAVGE